METIIRHLLSTISYRFQKSIKYADEGFFHYKGGEHARTPLEIINHMSNDLEHAKAQYTGKSPETYDLNDWDKAIKRFFLLLQEIDILESKVKISKTERLRMLQGPLCDVLTHIGQISMLSGLYGKPIEWENFMRAEVEIGELGKKEDL